MAEGLTPVEVFCCYSRADEGWLQKLENHLSPLKRQGLISLWSDRLIVPGTNWAETIDTHLETASVILLLVSSDFLASDYCYSIEMKRALEREAAGEARVVPILMRPVAWRETPFAHLQALPTDAQPVVSWQDQDTALADVAAGIRRTIEDVPMLAASAPRAALPAIWNVPYPRNPFFLGRDAELAQVHEHLQASQAAALSQPQAISGLGGVGKSQVALEYAYRYHQDYQMILWARAESTEALVSSYVALAQLLRLPERETKEQDVIVQTVKTWLHTHRGWLLILDNADELTLLPDFLPSAPGGHLLLTTRAAMTGRLAHRLEIETLEPTLGALFLLRRSGLLAPDATLEQASQEERELATQISEALGGLPLALDQAGAYLEETGMDLEGYWHLYQQHRGELLQERRGLVSDHPAPVATTWSLSFQRVQERSPAATDLLRLLAFLAPDAIPEEILTAGASCLGPVLAPVATNTFLLNPAIEALRAYSLIGRDRSGKTLSIHRLVQAVLQDAMDEVERHIWVERAMLAVNAVFPDLRHIWVDRATLAVFPDIEYNTWSRTEHSTWSRTEHSTWSRCERLLPQALAALQVIEQYQITSEEAGRLLHETAFYLQDRGRYAEAEPLFQHALRIREAQHEADHPQVASSMMELGCLYGKQGNYAQAEPLFQRALRIWEQQEAEHSQMAASLMGLASIYAAEGNYVRAEPLFQRALPIWEQQEAEHPFSFAEESNLYYQQVEQILGTHLRSAGQVCGCGTNLPTSFVHARAALRT